MLTASDAAGVLGPVWVPASRLPHAFPVESPAQGMGSDPSLQMGLGTLDLPESIMAAQTWI